MVVGDKSGHMELIELKGRIALRKYDNEHKNQINWLDFSPNKRNFVSCSNETSWKVFDIQNSKGSIATCHAAHSDHIKQVQFVPSKESLVISAG
jgi:WD40 repeat protein